VRHCRVANRLRQKGLAHGALASRAFSPAPQLRPLLCPPWLLPGFSLFAMETLQNPGASPVGHVSMCQEYCAKLS
jgi:hypothetical protein